MKQEKFIVVVLVLILLALAANLFGYLGVARSAHASPGGQIEFSATDIGLYFFDVGAGEVYKYAHNGRLTSSYEVRELGKDLNRLR